MTQRDEREKLREALKRILVDMIQRNSNRLIVVDYETTIDYILTALSPVPADGEAHAEIQRLQDAKRRALAIADERAKENVALRAALAAPASERVREKAANGIRTFCQSLGAGVVTMSAGVERIYYAGISLDALAVAVALAIAAPEPADTPDEGPDPLGYAKGERA